MTSKSRIHTYLVKNKISELFEEMMAKLVHDLPSNPVAYLSEMLKKKNLSNQKILETKPIVGQGSPVRSKSASLKLWSDPASSPVEKQRPATTSHKKDADAANRTSRQYNKPWLSHSKKSPSKEGRALSQSMPASEKPLWEKNARNSQDSVLNETTVDGEADLRLIYAKPKIYGKIPDVSSGLEAEMTSKHKNEVQGDSAKGQVKSKSMNKKQSKAERQKAIRALIDKENISKPSANEDNVVESDDDETVEVCEDFDDLHEEGVKNPPKGGVHVSRNTARRKEEIELVLNMSKFFDSLGGAVTPTPDIAANQNSPDIEDDFESASQVTGPRRPVWETPESEVDSVISKHSSIVARRKKTNMFDISSSAGEKAKSQLSADKLTLHKEPGERPGSAAYRAAEARRNAAAAIAKSSEEPTRKKSGGSQVHSVASNRGSLSHRSNRSSIERPKTPQ